MSNVADPSLAYTAPQPAPFGVPPPPKPSNKDRHTFAYVCFSVVQLASILVLALSLLNPVPFDLGWSLLKVEVVSQTWSPAENATTPNASTAVAPILAAANLTSPGTDAQSVPVSLPSPSSVATTITATTPSSQPVANSTSNNSDSQGIRDRTSTASEADPVAATSALRKRTLDQREGVGRKRRRRARHQEPTHLVGGHHKSLSRW